MQSSFNCVSQCIFNFYYIIVRSDGQGLGAKCFWKIHKPHKWKICPPREYISGFKQIIFSPFNAYTRAWLVAEGIKGSFRELCPSAWTWLWEERLQDGRVAKPGASRCWHQYSASSNTIIKTVFSDLSLLPYRGNCIQMQIDLNPINPFNHVCECTRLCVHAHVREHTSHMHLHLHKFSLEHLNPQSKISKWGEMLIFPGNFANCSCVLLINIS